LLSGSLLRMMRESNYTNYIQCFRRSSVLENKTQKTDTSISFRWHITATLIANASALLAEFNGLYPFVHLCNLTDFCALLNGCIVIVTPTLKRTRVVNIF